MRKIFIVLLVWSSCLSAIGQVNIQTGSATFSLPVFSWQDDRSRLMNGVSLQYSSAYGLRVDEVASNVGQGWGLLAGGVISRIQVGEPDDQKAKEGDYDNVNKYPAGYLYNSVSASNGCPTDLGKYPIFDHANQLYKNHNSVAGDREQDYFTFQVNGHSGTFILGKNNGDKGIMLGDSRVKIWFARDEALAASENTRTTIATFYLQDENGLIYTFNKRGKSKVLKIGTGQRQFATDYRVEVESSSDEIPLAENPYITTDWHLTQISDPLTSRVIDFTYAVRNIDNPDGNDIRCTSSDQNRDDVAIISKKRSITIMPVISGIQYPDGNNVTFNYDESLTRFDLKGDYRMKSIDISYNGRAVSSYRLNTAYFMLNNIGMPANGEQAKQARLCLRSVTKVGVDLKEDEPPYVFDYYTGTGNNGDFVPPPFHYFQDIWGYYNAGKNNDLLLDQATTGTIPYNISDIGSLTYPKVRALCFISDNGTNSTTPPIEIRTVNPGFAKNGLLKSITSPLGGVTTYEYEQNRLEGTSVYHFQTLEYGAGVHVSKVSQTNGGISFDGTNTVTQTYVYKKADGSTSFWGGNATPYNRIMSAYYYEPAGKYYNFFDGCKYDYTYPGILSREEFHSIPNENISAFLQTFSHVLTIANLALDAYSLVTGNPVPLIIDAVLQIVQIIKTCTASYSQYGLNYVVLNRDAYARNNLPYQFSRVEVIQGDALNNQGRTEYEFTSPADYPLWFSYYIKAETEWTNPLDPFTMKQQGAFWAYGLPKKVIVKDINNRKVKESEYIYNWNSPNIKRATGADMSCHCIVEKFNSMKSSDWMNLASSQNVNYTTSSSTYGVPGQMGVNAYDLKVDLYQLYTGRLELQDTYERNFKLNDDSRYTETHTHFEYNPNNYQVKRTSTTQSNGEKLVKELFYPEDYNTGGILKTLADNNIVNDPIATYSAIENNSGVSRYVGAVVNDFNTVPGGNIKLSRTLVNRSTAPVSGYFFDASNPFNFPGLVEVNSFQYNSKGNLSGMKDEGGHLVANIYDYDDKYIVASIINASPLTDRYAFTSFETQSMGGWSLSGNANYVNASVTGVRSLALSNGLLSVTLDQGKTYRLTCWATGAVTIGGAGATLITSGPVNNGFTYYEYEITATGSSVTVSGNVNIDELRLYPKMARMRTVVYDPLIGKTAECDENNRITYYEYDNQGRLRFIKDENRNIIKMYEYNFKK